MRSIEIQNQNASWFRQIKINSALVVKMNVKFQIEIRKSNRICPNGSWQGKTFRQTIVIALHGNVKKKSQ